MKKREGVGEGRGEKQSKRMVFSVFLRCSYVRLCVRARVLVEHRSCRCVTGRL